jgi:hypothetical protein
MIRMKKVFLLLFAALLLALSAWAQGMPSSPDTTTAQARTGATRSTAHRRHHRKHRKHRHHHRAKAQ